MSKIRLPSVRRPPPAESPTKLCSSRILRSSVRSIQTPSVAVASVKKPQTASGLLDMEESHIRPEDLSISCELKALAKMVEHELGNREVGTTDFPTTVSANPSHLFERGRFYEEYSARRNERLKRKKCGETVEDSRRSVCGLGVTVESGKKRDSKKHESLRKSVPINFSIGGTETPRYSLRSSVRAKENKKPPIIPINAGKSVGDGDRKVGARRVRQT